MGLGGGLSRFQTFVCPHLVDYFVFPAQGRETSNKGGKPFAFAFAKPLPSEIQSFFQSPPPPITRQHVEGGGEYFSVSPIPTPAVVWDRQCCTGGGEKRKRKRRAPGDDFDEKFGPIFFTGNYCSSDLYLKSRPLGNKKLEWP